MYGVKEYFNFILLHIAVQFSQHHLSALYCLAFCVKIPSGSPDCTKNLCAMQETSRRYEIDSWARKIPWSSKWWLSPVFLPGKYHGQRSLVGCSPWGHKESDTTEQLSTQHSTLYLLVPCFSSTPCCCSVMSNSSWPHGWLSRLLHPWDYPGKNTGVCCHFLLEGIFLTQWSNPGLPHCRQILYCLSHQGSPLYH